MIIVYGESYAFDAFWDDDRWKYKRIYNNKSYDSFWGKFRLPKVYRKTFSNHTEGPLSDKKVAREDIPPLFLNEKKTETGKVTLTEKKIRKYFPKEYNREQIEQVIYELLDNWKKSQ